MKQEEVIKFNEKFLDSFLKREEGLLFNLNARELVSFLPDNFAQTIYFDPPFSNNTQNDIPHTEDRQKGDYENYVWFVDNEKSFVSTCEHYFRQFHRILKDQGSVFLHLPWNLAYDIKPIADKVFGGAHCLRNEIVWVFRRWETNAGCLQENHHTILWYVKNPDIATFNRLEMPRTKETLKRFGEGKIVSAVDPTTGKRVPSKTEGKSSTTALNDVWVYDELQKRWLYELREIDEIESIQETRSLVGISHTAPIKKIKMWGTGSTYPFEKPIALIDRLIQLSTSNENDVVVDLFAGTGVVAESAKKNKRKYLLNEISKYTTLDIMKRVGYSKLVPGFPLFSHPQLVGKDIGKVSGREFEFWSGYSLGGVSDDSFRGQDSYHGLDVIVPVGIGDFVAGEVKKELKLMDEWYKIKSKAEKLLKEYPQFENRYAVVATQISRDIHHEMLNHQQIKFIPIQLDVPEKRFMLIDELLSRRVALEKVSTLSAMIDAEFVEETAKEKNTSKRKKDNRT